VRQEKRCLEPQAASSAAHCENPTMKLSTNFSNSETDLLPGRRAWGLSEMPTGRVHVRSKAIVEIFPNAPAPSLQLTYVSENRRFYQPVRCGAFLPCGVGIGSHAFRKYSCAAMDFRGSKLGHVFTTYKFFGL